MACFSFRSRTAPPKASSLASLPAFRFGFGFGFDGVERFGAMCDTRDNNAMCDTRDNNVRDGLRSVPKLRVPCMHIQMDAVNV